LAAVRIASVSVSVDRGASFGSRNTVCALKAIPAMAIGEDGNSCPAAVPRCVVMNSAVRMMASW